jgi:hypothetical protein
VREDSPTHLTRVVDNRLPLCTYDRVALAVKLIPESLLERGERIEVGHEIGIIALGTEMSAWYAGTRKAQRLATSMMMAKEMMKEKRMAFGQKRRDWRMVMARSALMASEVAPSSPWLVVTSRPMIARF